MLIQFYGKASLGDSREEEKKEMMKKKMMMG